MWVGSFDVTTPKARDLGARERASFEKIPFSSFSILTPSE